MRKQVFFFPIAGLLLLLAISAYGQDEQWLQYHSAREVSLLGIRTYSRSIEISKEIPESENIELPVFKSKEPLFARWRSPMVPGGILWVALDRTYENGIYDNLYIDSNGDGRLSDEAAVETYRMTQNYSYFGPVKVIFKIEDGPVTYHLNFRFYDSSDNEKLYVYTGGWYQGDITVNGKEISCVIFDYNINGTFNDKSDEPEESDRIKIGLSSSQNTTFVGSFIDINGTLYEPEIARDGAYIKLVRAQNVKYGNIRLPEGITQFSAGGKNGSFTIKPENGIGKLPIGKYRLTEWAIERKDESGTQWKLQGTYGTTNRRDRNESFETTEAKDTDLSFGEPIISVLGSMLRSGTYSFSQSLSGRDGETVTLTRNGAQPQAPKLNIRNEDGSYDRTFSFSYG